MTDSENDDIVIRLNLGNRGTGDDPSGGADPQREGARGGRGRRGRRFRALRRTARRINSARTVARRISTIGRIARGASTVRTAASMAMRMGAFGRLGALANPVTASVVAAALTAALAYRAISGRSFENMIQNVKRRMYAGYDLKARASNETRDELMSDPNLMLLAAQGTANDQLKYVFDTYRKLRLTYLEGEKIIRTDKDFQSGNAADQFLDNWVEKAHKAWNAANGNALFRWLMASGS